MIRVIFILTLSLLSIIGYGQQNVFDSLYQEAINAESNYDKSYYFDEASRAILRYNPDSALEVASLGLEFAQKASNDTIISDAYNSLGVIQRRLGNYANAISVLEKSLKHAEASKAYRQIENANSALALVYDDQGSYSAALEIYYKILLGAKNRMDTSSMARVSNNMANIYFEQGIYDKALDYYQSAYKYAVVLNLEFGQGLLLGNIGSVYYKQKKYDEALLNFKASQNISSRIDDVEGLGIGYVNIAGVFFERKMYDSALVFQQKALEIKQLLNDEHGKGIVFNELGKIFQYKGDLKKAISYCEKALSISKSIGSIEQEREAHEALYKIYDAKGDVSKGYIHYKKYVLYRDSLINEETKKKDIRNELNFQYEKKHFSDSLLHMKKEMLVNQKLSNEKLKNESQKKLTYTFIGAFLLMLLLASFIFKQYKAKNKANQIILSQKREVEHQSEIILEKNKEITDSINYAKRIQTALLTSDEYWKEISEEHFVFFKPKDVVSGDFFWAFKTENDLAIWVAADCTGHGVPGAFMSMLGIGFLNEIVVENNVTSAPQILNSLRDKIIKALEQKGVEMQQRDGMDLALCVWDKKSNILEYSGANNPLWLVRNIANITEEQKLERGSLITKNSGLGLVEYKANKQPVGFYREANERQPFTSIEIQLFKGDVIYAFSDGFADQFGGVKGKKYKYKPFKELLLEISKKPLNLQKKKLEDEFNSWKGELEQIDDVCVIGVKI